MGKEIIEAIATIAGGVIAVAMVAVLVSRNSNTTGVLQAASSGFSNALGVAASPVTHSAVELDLSYPNSGGFTGNAAIYG